MTVGEFIFKIGFKTDKASKGKAEGEMQDLASTAKKLLGAIGIGFSVKGAYEAIKQCVNISSEVQEMQNKFDVVFRGMTEDVEEWAQSYSDSIGRNSNAIKGYMADTQNLMVGMGMEREAGAELSKQMITLAMDLASFNNLNETDAVNAMTKALMGESESAKTLGAVLNDNTRAVAMQTMGLTGNYQALDEATKMQVNYQAILNQSADAIGDCERSMGSYQSTLNQTKAKLEEVKTIVGQFFMPTFQKVLTMGSTGLMKLRDYISKITEFAEKIGGTDRLIRLMAASAAALVVALNFNKIIGGVKAFFKLFNLASLKIMAVVATVVLLVLIVDDFIQFMKGNNSVLGSMLEKAGIDVDEVRDKITKTWETIKTTLIKIWNFVKGIAVNVWNSLKNFWTENGEAIKDKLLQIWNSISTVLSALWKAIKSIAQTVFGALKTFWENWGEEISAVFSICWAAIQNQFMIILDIITNIFNAFAALFSGDWDALWEAVKGIFQGIWNAIQNILSTFLNVMVTLFGERITKIKDTIVNGFNAAIDFIKGLPAKALQWGADFVQGLIDGIKSKVGAVADSVKGVGKKIASFLHFSVPDEGPLTTYEQWMPDFMRGLARGIKDNQDLVVGAVKQLAGDIDVHLHPENPDKKPKPKGRPKPHFDPRPKPDPVGVSARTAAAVTNRSESKIINQTNNFENHFVGGERDTQRNLARATSQQNKDASAELARALSFA